MTRTVITEDMPSSGNAQHTCNWQVVENKNGHMTLVCTNPSCNKTKVVPAPRVEESRTEKPLLFG